VKRVPAILRRRAAAPERRGAPTGAIGVPWPTLAGVMVTPQSALTFTAVFGAINTIATDLAALGMGVFERKSTQRGAGSPVYSHPNVELLDVTANAGESPAMRSRQAAQGHALGWGNSYSEILRDGAGYARGLDLLHPRTWEPKRLRGRLLYVDNETGRQLLAENVLHIAGLGFDGLRGYSPITLARQAIGLGMAAEEFGEAFFGNGATSKGALKTPKKLSTEARKNLRESINAVHQGARNAHKFLILEEGLDWINTQINPDDAQFLATRQFQILEIARIFRVPPHKLGDYSQAHLANLEESNADYLQTTLMGWVLAWETEINLKLFTAAERAAGLHVRCNLRQLLRGNMAARGTYYQVLRNLGCLSADDIRGEEGLNPIGPAAGGDNYVIQGQYIPLADVGKAKPAAPVPPPIAGAPADPSEPANPGDGNPPTIGDPTPEAKP
jgi:HK97 family phage portal protein